MSRTPDQIRDHAMKAFNQIAPHKYNTGQEEHGGILDERDDIVTECRNEAVDLWFYLEAVRHQMDEKDSRIARLEAEVERWKEMAKR
jgi:hypothetical protein